MTLYSQVESILSVETSEEDTSCTLNRIWEETMSIYERHSYHRQRGDTEAYQYVRHTLNIYLAY